MVITGEKNLMHIRDYRNQPARAGAHTDAASIAFSPVHHGNAILIDGQGAEGTLPHAGEKAKAPVNARLGTVIEKKRGTAIDHSLIDCTVWGFTISTLAMDRCYCSFGRLGIDFKGVTDRMCRARTSRNATERPGIPARHRFCKVGTTGIAAYAAIEIGQRPANSVKPGVKRLLPETGNNPENRAGHGHNARSKDYWNKYSHGTLAY
jgi:hypothetical protein